MVLPDYNMCVLASGGLLVALKHTHTHAELWHDKQKAMKPHE